MPVRQALTLCGSILLAHLLFNASPVTAAESEVRVVRDLVYAEASDVKLQLDLYLPQQQNARLAVFIHGGSWRAGSRQKCPVLWLTQHGYAVASIDYRLSQQAVFPAAIHDCKAAVRWLRAHADEYGYQADQTVVLGSSAGGHLALLLGTSGGVESLEGTVGGHLDQSSRVAAVVDYYGASDFLLRSKLQPQNTEQPSGNVYQLLGGPVRQNVKLAQLASGVTHVDKQDPPLLILHGLLDNKVNPYQAVRIYQAYQKAGLPVQFKLLPDASHGGEEFYAGEYRTLVLQFLERSLATAKQERVKQK